VVRFPQKHFIFEKKTRKSILGFGRSKSQEINLDMTPEFKPITVPDTISCYHCLSKVGYKRPSEGSDFFIADNLAFRR